MQTSVCFEMHQVDPMMKRHNVSRDQKIIYIRDQIYHFVQEWGGELVLDWVGIVFVVGTIGVAGPIGWSVEYMALGIHKQRHGWYDLDICWLIFVLGMSSLV